MSEPGWSARPAGWGGYAPARAGGRRLGRASARRAAERARGVSRRDTAARRADGRGGSGGRRRRRPAARPGRARRRTRHDAGGGGGHGGHDAARRAAPAWTGGRSQRRWLRPAVEARRRPAGVLQRGARAGAASAPAQRASGAPLKARLATVAKPCSSARSASSRCAVRSPPRAARGRRAHAPAVNAAPAGAHAAARRASPTSQTPSAPRSSTSPVRGVQVARLVADEVAEQPERDGCAPGLGAGAAPAARRRDARAAPGVELGDHPRVRERVGRDREASAARAPAGARRRHERHACARRCRASTAARGGAAAPRRRAARQ